MKKVIFNRFGGTEVLEMSEADRPLGEVVVKVKAVSMNPLDWKIWQGDMKLMSGRKFPKSVGIDFSGVVEQGGGNFRAGDEVLGVTSIFKGGALAEYVAVRASDIVLKPRDMSFEAAASLPVAGSAALQIFEKLVVLRPGMEVLINGAGGGIGLFAVQLAKNAGAVVTSVVGSAAVDLVRELGSDAVINYHQQNVLTAGRTFDAVIDLSGTIGYKSGKGILKKGGVFVNTTPTPLEMLRSLFSRGRYKLLVLKPSAEEFARVAAMGWKVMIGKRYDWYGFKEAYDEVKKGGLVGKGVLVLS